MSHGTTASLAYYRDYRKGKCSICNEKLGPGLRGLCDVCRRLQKQIHDSHNDYDLHRRIKCQSKEWRAVREKRIATLQFFHAVGMLGNEEGRMDA